jgi:glutamate synthase (NADPH/NADH) large chain
MNATGLYDSRYEHDACGVGFVADIRGTASHQTVTDGITVLKNLVHRGAVGGDLTTGDGAGMLVRIPHRFFSRTVRDHGFELGEPGTYGVGFLFMPPDTEEQTVLARMVKEVVESEGGRILGWRDVPVRPDTLGDIARRTMPFMRQVFVQFDGLDGDPLERKLYVVRKVVQRRARELPPERFYVASLSARTVVYKGMFVAPQLEEFYPDLSEQDFESAFALVHARYSTNTFPSWPLAQPFRRIAHNGEINTLRGNINGMAAREGTLRSPLFGDDIVKLFPIVTPGGSDSAAFDNVLELLTMAGRSIAHAMMMMVPEPFGQKFHMSEDKRAFYEYHAAIMEPWDGPAAIAFTDGVSIGAALDRNGLRPARYTITRSGRMVLASETGVLDIPPEDVLEKGLLGPGTMILVDTAAGRVRKNDEIKAQVSRTRLYRRWLQENRIQLSGLFESPHPLPVDRQVLTTAQITFGYTYEDITTTLVPMVETAQEPVGSMGDDEAPAVLSERPQSFTRYFKQLFAQVTNPPIDPYRESLVMSLMSFIGRERNLLEETPEHCRLLKLAHPVLTNDDVDRLLANTAGDFRCAGTSMLFPAADGPEGMEPAVGRLCDTVERLVDDGYAVIVLSDRGCDAAHAPIPALLAVSAVHNHLVRRAKRHLAGLVVCTGAAVNVMDFATLIGYGAGAVNPYLAFETLADLKARGAAFERMKVEEVFEQYITAVKKGLLKVMSKMGISTIRSYRGAQLFEALGLNSAFVEKYFPGTASRIEGVGITEIARETLMRHARAWEDPRPDRILDIGGHHRYRRDSEKHLTTPEAVVALQRAVREGDYTLFKEFSSRIDRQEANLCTLRGLFTFRNVRPPVPLDEVEPEESIVKRFVSSAMSFGSISPEAHETIARAMNRLGAQSNAGEGGEDESRYTPDWSGDTSMSKVKQVASGRFGVTSNYLVHAQELQIKMAQGAKPGEGGQLPGHKVDPLIAKVRHSTPGVMLISPPPHHDIYSIEDLAQLIHDLKCASPGARVSVKLVAEVGVGTVAAGVAKARADMVLISGGDGGTGASPLSSIKYAGIPWEIGLAETQQTLVLNRLRDKIRVQVDGQMRTGRDVVIAALLGAEEFGFGTVSLMSLGCVMMRKCHLNTCPVGVATQDPRLRARFSGKPEHLMNYMRFVAREARELMARLGFRTVDEMVGRADLLDVNRAITHWKAHGLDFSRVFAVPDSGGLARRCMGTPRMDSSALLDTSLIEQAREALEHRRPVRLTTAIRNRNRSVGARLSAEVSRRYGSAGLPPGTLHVKFSGVAGQSFGAFLARGITFELEGDANDYFGKGLSGGSLIVYPQRGSTFKSQNNIIVGNVCLFGATAGEVFIQGMAGERFAVRNSGATAVVEGVGDHGCEYMTGGRVVILGETGVNFAAGMSGGIAYVLDTSQLFDTRCNLEMVDLEPVRDPEDIAFLRTIIRRHAELTGSRHADEILRSWDDVLPAFVKVFPIDYKKALERIREQQRRSSDEMTITEEV